MAFGGEFSWSSLNERDGNMWHVPAQDRAYAVPQPPRIYIPPPHPDGGTHDPETLLARACGNLESSSDEKVEFLRRVTGGAFKPRDTILDWKYEERRQAQAILPFLYLGPSVAARDKKFLQETGITMVMAVRDMQSAVAKLMNPKASRELGLHSINIDVEGLQQLIAAFPRATDEINDHLLSQYHKKVDAGAVVDSDSPGKILLFCETGNERSACVAAAYLMTMYSVDVVTAIQVLQSQRFCLAIDDSMRELLLSYHSILQARRDISTDMNALSLRDKNKRRDTEGKTNSSQSKTAPGSTKRNLSDFNEDDTDMAGGHGELDLMRFQERAVSAPFEDMAEHLGLSESKP